MLPLHRHKVGFLVQDTGPSELSFAILNGGTNNNHIIDTTCFFERITKPCIDSLVAKMHIYEAYAFDGPIIATNLNTAAKLLTFPSPRPKLFFINDLEWIRIPNKQFNELHRIYGNPNLTLLCRSESHKKMVENCWNRKVDFVIHRYDFYQDNLLSYLIENNKSIYGENKLTPLNIKSLNL